MSLDILGHGAHLERLGVQCRNGNHLCRSTREEDFVSLHQFNDVYLPGLGACQFNDGVSSNAW